MQFLHKMAQSRSLFFGVCEATISCFFIDKVNERIFKFLEVLTYFKDLRQFKKKK